MDEATEKRTLPYMPITVEITRVKGVPKAISTNYDENQTIHVTSEDPQVLKQVEWSLAHGSFLESGERLEITTKGRVNQGTGTAQDPREVRKVFRDDVFGMTDSTGPIRSGRVTEKLPDLGSGVRHYEWYYNVALKDVVEDPKVPVQQP